jgi:hypothetical protein
MQDNRLATANRLKTEIEALEFYMEIRPPTCAGMGVEAEGAPDLSAEFLEILSSRIAALVLERSRRTERCQSVRAQLASLWDKLKAKKKLHCF